MMRCSDDSLEALLDADDAGSECRDVADHVESCAPCQTRLGQLAAEAADWREAKKWLADRGAAPDDDQGPCRRDGHRRSPAWTESMASQLLSPPSHPEMLGRIGRYDVDRLIGAGGMGVVFKAFDTELNRPVAVKVLAPYLAGSGGARQRFAREARAAAAVVDEHVVAIHNVESDGESPFLVMQYVAGESLQARLDRCGPLEVCEILRIGMQTAAGLAAAHAQGLVHRDVKPSNILLEERVDRALLTDFGLARAGDDASLTHTGYHPGTPQYMSPEQARGESVDQRSDLFSLGSVMYAMCTGRAPFRAETSYGVLRRITDQEPRPIREINPDIPQWLCQIIARLMSKRADDRFESAREVAELLEGCLAHLQQPTAVPLPGSCRSLRESSQRNQPRGADTLLLRKPTARTVRLVRGAAFGLAMIVASVFIVLELNKGKLTIESEADNVPVRIMQGDTLVEKLTVTRTGASVRIAAGQYVVEIAGKTDGLTVENGTVRLQRRGREVVRIVKEDHAPDAGPAPREIKDGVQYVDVQASAEAEAHPVLGKLIQELRAVDLPPEPDKKIHTALIDVREEFVKEDFLRLMSSLILDARRLYIQMKPGAKDVVTLLIAPGVSEEQLRTLRRTLPETGTRDVRFLRAGGDGDEALLNDFNELLKRHQRKLLGGQDTSGTGGTPKVWPKTAVSKDEQLIATLTLNDVVVSEAEPPRNEVVWFRMEVPGKSIAFSDDGTQLAVVTDEGVRYYGARSGKLLRFVPTQTQPEWTDGGTNEGATTEHARRARTSPAPEQGDSPRLRKTAFSKDRRLMAQLHHNAGDVDAAIPLHDVIEIEDIETRDFLRVIHIHEVNGGKGIEFSDDGQVLAFFTDEGVRYYAVRSGYLTRFVPTHAP